MRYEATSVVYVAVSPYTILLDGMARRHPTTVAIMDEASEQARMANVDAAFAVRRLVGQRRLDLIP